MKKQKHFLDEIVEQNRIEKAQREARKIYNYNQWKNQHDKLVENELRKLEKKNHKLKKRRLPMIFIILINMFLCALFYQEIVIERPEILEQIINIIMTSYKQIRSIISS